MTREEAIKELQSYADHSWGGLSEAFELAIDALREQEGKDTNVPTKWISVEDRLPEKYTTVLCYKDKQWQLGYYFGDSYLTGAAAFRLPKDQFAFGVTHWMPLPEPPEVDG